MNLGKYVQELFGENYKILLKDIKDLKKGRDLMFKDIKTQSIGISSLQI